LLEILRSFARRARFTQRPALVEDRAVGRRDDLVGRAQDFVGIGFAEWVTVADDFE
jgi:hypothetical protein